MSSDTEITKVRIVIRHLLWQIREVRNDRDAAWQWVNRFANTLQYQELEQDPDQYALAILAEARSFNDLQRRKGQMLGVRKQLAKEGVTNPTQEQLDEKWLEMYGNETTADAHTREDGVNESDGRDAVYLESSTSANIYGDAATSDGAEAATSRESGRSTPATVSNNSKARESRRTGAEPRGVSHSAPVRLPSYDEFTRFVDQQGLDYTDAREWWEMTMVDREGKDRDGKPIRNWKGALKRFCTTKTANRRSA